MNVALKLRQSGSLRLLSKPAVPSNRVILFPWAGGTASSMSRLLNGQIEGIDDIEFWAVQYPGRESRFDEPSASSMEALCRTIADELSLLSDLPLGFCGHSMGAVVAFETARQLEMRFRLSPEFVVVSGSSAPCKENRFSNHANLHERSLLAELRQYQGTPAAIYDDPVLLQLTLKHLKADRLLIKQYQPKTLPKLKAPLHVFYGDQDNTVNPQGIAAWESFCENEPDFTRFSGDHFYLLTQSELFLDTLLNEAMGVLI